MKIQQLCDVEKQLRYDINACEWLLEWLLSTQSTNGDYLCIFGKDTNLWQDFTDPVLCEYKWEVMSLMNGTITINQVKVYDLMFFFPKNRRTCFKEMSYCIVAIGSFEI